MSQPSYIYNQGIHLARNSAFNAGHQRNPMNTSGSVVITIRRVVVITLWMIFQLTLLIYRIVDSIASPKGAIDGYNKGIEMLIMVDISLIYLLMSPTLMGLLRKTFLPRYISIEKNLHAHKFIGYTLLLCTLQHVVSHYFKFYGLQEKTHGKLSMVDLLFKKQTGLVGHIMIGLTLVFTLAALPWVRKKFFEVFYFLHHFSILLVILLDFHTTKNPTFRYYILGPGLIYLMDRLYRMIRARINQPRLLSVIQHPSNVIELRFEKRGMAPKVGQFVYINIPSISWFQWHPFTLTSSPEESELSAHIWVGGDWTKELINRLKPQAYNHRPSQSTLINSCASLMDPLARKPIKQMSPQYVQTLPKIMVDGPYSSATQHVFDYQHILLIAGGIGATPMSSVLKSLYYQMTSAGTECKVLKVYFLWVCRNIESLEWFRDLLAALDEENMGDKLEIRTYLTGQLSLDHIRSITMNQEVGGPDAVTGLYRSPTYFGRPDFDRIYEDVGSRLVDTDVGVFFCGPKEMSRHLRRINRKWNWMFRHNHTRFVWHEEKS